jgi:hypothetical protein
MELPGRSTHKPHNLPASPLSFIPLSQANTLNAIALGGGACPFKLGALWLNSRRKRALQLRRKS